MIYMDGQWGYDRLVSLEDPTLIKECETFKDQLEKRITQKQEELLEHTNKLMKMDNQGLEFSITLHDLELCTESIIELRELAVLFDQGVYRNVKKGR